MKIDYFACLEIVGFCILHHEMHKTEKALMHIMLDITRHDKQFSKSYDVQVNDTIGSRKNMHLM